MMLLGESVGCRVSVAVRRPVRCWLASDLETRRNGGIFLGKFPFECLFYSSIGHGPRLVLSGFLLVLFLSGNELCSVPATCDSASAFITLLSRSLMCAFCCSLVVNCVTYFHIFLRNKIIKLPSTHFNSSGFFENSTSFSSSFSKVRSSETGRN